MAFHYQIEIRNTADELVEILQADIASLFWRYDALGGCSECEIQLRRPFDNFGNIDLDYDVQIWRTEDPFGSPGTALPAMLPIALGTGFTSSRELRWSGFVRDIAPALEEVEKVFFRCSGYARQAEYLVVPNQTYAAMDVGAIARSIVDTYVLPGSRIQRTGALNLMQDTGIVANSLRFDSSAFDAIKTLAEIGGNAEWGVRADREFYFLPRSVATKQVWEVGDRIKFFHQAKSSDQVVNWVYLRGGSGFSATLQHSAYVADYQKERVVFVPSISGVADATLWGTSYFARFGAAQPSGRLKIGASDAWIENVDGENMPPIGRLRVHGGATESGGGVDILFRVDSVLYVPTENGLDIEISLGEKRGAFVDLFRGIEFKISELRQGL